MTAQPRLIALPTSALQLIVSADLDGTWEVTVAAVPPGKFLATADRERYGRLTMSEAIDVVVATMSGVEHPGAPWGGH